VYTIYTSSLTHCIHARKFILLALATYVFAATELNVREGSEM